ncbi:MAG: hypothetical protein PHD35_12035 [Synergistaceae bacterium]|jgi:hypothetical protein|nr:hypothetical protein [Synergistaceae bacterium]
MNEFAVLSLLGASALVTAFGFRKELGKMENENPERDFAITR